MQEVIWKFDIGFVNFVDEQDWAHVGFEGFPDFAFIDVVFNVVNTIIAELRIAKPRDCVIFIKALLGLGRGFDVPFD